MKCPKCGAELLDEAVFCMSCGTKIESVNEDSQENKDTDKNNSKKTSGKKSKKPLVLFILILVIALAGAGAYLYFFTDFFKAKIDLNNYIDVDFEGYNTIGHVEMEFDRDKLESDYGKRIDSSMKKFIANFNFKIDKAEHLSNDDVVTLSWDYDADEIKEEYGVVVIAEEKKYTVSGLKDLETFDPFEGVEVEFSGIAPMGSALISKTPNSNGLSYSLSSYNNDLKNGDSVVVTVSYGQQSEEEYADKYGRIPAVKEKSFVVSGLDEYIMSYEDIPVEIQNKMKGQAEDIILSYIASQYDSNNSVSPLEYAGYMYCNKKDINSDNSEGDSIIEESDDYWDYDYSWTEYMSYSDEDIANCLFLIYRGTVSNSKDNFYPTTVYYPVFFTNILNKSGSISYVEGNAIVGDSYFPHTYYNTRGYVEPISCYSKINNSVASLFEVVCGDGFEKYESYTYTSSLDDINEDLRQKLMDESYDEVKEYVSDFSTEYLTMLDWRWTGGDDLAYAGEYLLTAKNPGNELTNNSMYYIVYKTTLTRSHDGKSVTCYYPVRYEGIVSLSDGETLVLDYRGISGTSNLPDEWSHQTKGYIDGAKMYDALITSNRSDYTYTMTEDLKQFGD